MSDDIRWYNRLAAWFHEIVAGSWLVDLALPVWQAEADAEYDEMENPGPQYDDDDMHQAYLEGVYDSEVDRRERDL